MRIRKLIPYLFLIGVCLNAQFSVHAQWIKTNGPANVICIGVSAGGDTVLAGTGTKGIFRSTDYGFSWARMSTGIPSDSSINFIAMGSSAFFAGLSNSIFRSTDGGSSWVSVADSVWNLQGLKSRNGILLAAQDSSLRTSIDNGIHWSALKTSYQIRGITISGSNLLAATSGPMLQSLDQGQNWNVIDSAPKNVSTITSDGANILVSDLSDIYYSHDNGIDWSHGAIFKGYFYEPQQCDILAVGGNLLMATRQFNFAPNQFWWSNTIGITWDTGGLYNNNGWAKVAVAGGEMFVGQGGPVSVSSDAGSTWVDAGIPETFVMFDTIVACGRFILVVLPDTIWRSPLLKFGVSSQLEKKDLFLNNYPNPFSEKTEIRFSSAERSFTQVFIVNLLGEEVANLFSGELEAGEHSFKWDASHIPTGMYGCVIRTNNGFRRLPITIIR